MSLQICFHGTDAEGAIAILDAGFDPYTYFALNLQDAVEFGGDHIFEVKFNKREIIGVKWQFRIEDRVPVYRIVSHYTFKKIVIFDSESLRKKIFNSNRPVKTRQENR